MLTKSWCIQERVYYLYREKKQPLVLEPYLNHILDKQVHEVLRQRITVHYNYEGLSDQEVPDYICHKLELAGTFIKNLGLRKGCGKERSAAV